MLRLIDIPEQISLMLSQIQLYPSPNITNATIDMLYQRLESWLGVLLLSANTAEGHNLFHS